MDEKVREEQIDFIKKVKPLLRSNLIQKDYVQEVTDADLREHLIQRIEKIERLLEGEKQIDGVRKTKVKDQIISLLKENKKLTSSQLGELIGLSRTRCNEYLRELAKEGLTEGIIINRRKFYKLVKMSSGGE